MNKTVDQLTSEILALIARGPLASSSDAEFDALARAIFLFQYAHNAPYRAYCDRLQRPVHHWRDIPAVPTSAFKDFTLTCFPPAQAVAEFHTSGTTRAQCGKHYFATLALYDASCRPNFFAHLFPDQPLPIWSLVPPSPHSSLAHMITAIGGSFVPQLEAVHTPVCIVATAFHLVKLFDQGFRLPLPAGSRVMETGGYKGRSREIPKRELYHLITERLGVPPTHIVNEYGMTELSTQFYDETMLIGRPSDLKRVPPWARVLIIDPQTSQEAPPGQPGLIRIVDLANLGSVVCVQTDDLGVARPGGFEILGRAPGAEVRGCSLVAE